MTYPFSLTTTNQTSSSWDFRFSISAKGTFYVDCGTNGTLSRVSGGSAAVTASTGKISKTGNVTVTLFKCQYTSSGSKTIQFGGTATAYNTNVTTPAIGLSVTSGGVNYGLLISSISGNLSTILPIYGTTSGSYPSFYVTFGLAANLTSIPATLFASYTSSGGAGMFSGTFNGCTSLTSIPETLFNFGGNNVSGQDEMFNGTFYGCTGLTSIPENLFRRVTSSANSLFVYTFYGCTGLTSIPENLFNFGGNNVSGQSTMFGATFTGCTGLTSIPANLFQRVTSSAEYLYATTFSGCTGLTSIPENLFNFGGNNVSGQDSMFYTTFYGCPSLTSIPANLFQRVTGGAANLFTGTFRYCSGLTSIPSNLFSNITTGASQMFWGTFRDCTSLTSLPESLFANITTGATEMFLNTFDGDTNLSGYIPKTMFAGLIANGHPVADNMWKETFINTQLVTSCPTGTVQYITGYEGTTDGATWNGKVSCIPAYTITLNDSTNGGSGGSGTIKEVYATKWTNSSGTTISSVTVPTKANSVFLGYYNSASGSTQYINASGTITASNTTFSANTTIYAKFSACTACSPTNANCTLSVSNNTCTYTTSCKGGYGTLVNGGKYNPSCTKCSAGTASADGNNTCSACSGRTKYSAAGAASCSTVSSGYYTTGCNSSNNNCTGQSQCTGATYCASGVQNNCPSQTSGWTRGTGNGWTAVTSCYETRTPANCASGTIKHNATSSSAWGSASVTSALSSNGGYYVNGTACSQCGAGTYYGGGTATSCTQCPANSFCGVGATEPTACSTLGGGLYTKSAAGSDENTDCYITTTAGKYLKANTDTAQTTCPKYKYCVSANVYYPNVNTPAACPAADSSTEYTTYPDDFYNPTRTSFALYTSTGLKAITACIATYTFTNVRGTLRVRATYSNSTSKYSTKTVKVYDVFNAGYYGTMKHYTDEQCNSSVTNKSMYYEDAQQCPAGSYCPGLSSMPGCNTGTYEDTIGLNACSALTGVSPTGGTYTSTAGSAANTACKYTAPNKTITGCATVTTNTMTYTGSAWPASTYTVTPSTGYSATNNNTANATCTVNTINMTWDTASGTPASCTYGSTFVPPTPTRTGYSFTGWKVKTVNP